MELVDVELILLLDLSTLNLSLPLVVSLVAPRDSLMLLFEREARAGRHIDPLFEREVKAGPSLTLLFDLEVRGSRHRGIMSLTVESGVEHRNLGFLWL